MINAEKIDTESQKKYVFQGKWEKSVRERKRNHMYNS